MGKRLQTIYEYFSEYSEKEIDNMINSLSAEYKEVIRDRYGDDLHNPKPTDKWDKERSKEFYGILVPKMKKMLLKGWSNEKQTNSQEETEQRNIIEIVSPKIETVDNVPLLLQLLKAEKSNTEICEKLNITTQQLYEQLLNLKNKGVTHLRKYYSDGTIKYKSILTMSELKRHKEVN